jgi:hypothetical protein
MPHSAFVDSARFSYSGESIKLTDQSAGIHKEFYVAHFGDLLSEYTLLAGGLGEPLLFDKSVNVGSGEFFLGVWVRGYPAGEYGWVHLRLTNGVVTMVENVMAYNVPGIIVGTTTVVPEPAALPIALAALAMSYARNRPSRNRKSWSI